MIILQSRRRSPWNLNLLRVKLRRIVLPADRQLTGKLTRRLPMQPQAPRFSTR